MRNLLKKDKFKYILAFVFTLVLSSCSIDASSTTDLRSIDKNKTRLDSFIADEIFDPTSGSYGGNVYQIDTVRPNQGYYFYIYEYKNGNISSYYRSDDFYIAMDEYLAVETLDGLIHSVVFGDGKYKNVLDYKYKDKDIFKKTTSVWDWIDEGDFKDGGIFIFSSVHSDKNSIISYDLNLTGLDELTKDKNASGIVIELRLSGK